MKILVCIKQVMARESTVQPDEKATWIREADLSFEMNEPDAYALEAALLLKESHGGEVVACSVGPARAQQAIREALAKGADRAIHIEDLSPTTDSARTARLIAAAVRQENFDLICAGLQSDDLGLGQTGVILAELLGLPHATIVMEVQVAETGLKVKRELEGGWSQWVELPLPALLTIQSGISKLRYATLRGIKSAKTKEIRRLTPAELEGSGSSQPAGFRLHRIYMPSRSKQTQYMTGTPQEASALLVQKLQRDAKVL